MHACQRLLVVDDDRLTRLLLSEILTEQGLEVATAEDGFSALREIASTLPNIILSDLNMPGMSGFELLSVVRQRFPSIYVIASSGAYEANRIPDGLAADAFYKKASGITELFRVIESAQRSPQAFRSRDLSHFTLWTVEDLAPRGELTVVSCPACRRVYERNAQTSAEFVDERCPHCQFSFRSAVAKVLGPLPEESYHQQLCGKQRC